MLEHASKSVQKPRVLAEFQTMATQSSFHGMACSVLPRGVRKLNVVLLRANARYEVGVLLHWLNSARYSGSKWHEVEYEQQLQLNASTSRNYFAGVRMCDMAGLRV